MGLLDNDAAGGLWAAMKGELKKAASLDRKAKLILSLEPHLDRKKVDVKS